MKLKLLKFDEIVSDLRNRVIELEEWSDEYSGIFSKEINDLFYIINGLECCLDDLIADLEKEKENDKKTRVDYLWHWHCFNIFT